MYKKILVTILIFILGTVSIGCSNNTPENIDKKNISSLTIGVLPDVNSIPFVIAESQGYFAEEGLNVEIQHFKSAVDRDTALQTGNIDGAISDMLSVVFLNDNGFDVKITSKTNGSFKLIAGKNSNITKLKDVKDKRIGISRNTIIEYLTDRIIESSNINIKSPKKVAIPKIPTRLEMLKNGKIDMATLPEPLASVSVSEGGKVLSNSDELGLNPGVMLFNAKTIKSKDEELKAFYRAYNKAVKYLKTEELENYIDILIKEAGFPKRIKNTLILPEYSLATMPPEKEFNKVLVWLKSKDLTTSNYTLDELSDDSFINNQ